MTASIICPECGGACEVISLDDDGNERLIVCPTCGGEGSVDPDEDVDREMRGGATPNHVAGGIR